MMNRSVRMNRRVTGKTGSSLLKQAGGYSGVKNRLFFFGGQLQRETGIKGSNSRAAGEIQPKFGVYMQITLEIGRK